MIRLIGLIVLSCEGTVLCVPLLPVPGRQRDHQCGGTHEPNTEANSASTSENGHFKSNLSGAAQVRIHRLTPSSQEAAQACISPKVLVLQHVFMVHAPCIAYHVECSTVQYSTSQMKAHLCSLHLMRHLKESFLLHHVNGDQKPRTCKKSQGPFTL